VRPRTQAPRVWIELSLESAPRLLMDAMSEAEFDRLADWIRSQDDLHDLFIRAVESEDRRRRRVEE
jgi:hypothetical protein